LAAEKICHVRVAADGVGRDYRAGVCVCVCAYNKIAIQ